MSDDLREKEKWVTRAYSERRFAPDGGLNFWRNVIFRDELIYSYCDPGFVDYIFTKPIAAVLSNRKCMIADFGSGDGHVAQTVVSQLGRQGDRAVLSVGIDIDRVDLLAMKQEGPDVQPVQGNLLHLPFAPNSFDAGILRFALPFISEENQPRMFEQIYSVLKDGAVLVVLNDGVLETETAAHYNTLFAECAASTGRWTVDQLLTDRHFPSCESLKFMAEEAGFEVKAESVSDLTDIAFGYISPEIYATAVPLKEDQYRRLENVFKEWKEKDVLPFEPKPDSLRVPLPMYTCVLQKKRISPSP